MVVVTEHVQMVPLLYLVMETKVAVEAVAEITLTKTVLLVEVVKST